MGSFAIGQYRQIVQQDGVVQGDDGLRNFQREERKEKMVDALRDQVGEQSMTILYEGTLRVDVEIRLNGGLTRRMVGVRATINSMQIEEWSNLDAFDEGTKVIQLAKAKLGSEGLSTEQEDIEAGTLEEYAKMLPFELS
ncbi:hypothetical protein B296_00012913 [Ensete ventricosum]|uniref:Uncharacterized protein n=1 Tax=Ensete ventricosum TaxID=4639 RepID=A0A427AAE1_ENSVE|nr:hypothetical protein B296_00012913 [Ensete ventricosum]